MFKTQVGRWCGWAGLLAIAMMLIVSLPAMAQVIQTLPNAGFEELRPGGGKMMPVKWWLNPREGGVQPKDPNAYGVSSDVALGGKYSAYIDSAAQGTIGWISDIFPVPSDMPGYRLTARLKRSADYEQNQPIIMLFWFKGDRWIGQSLGKFVSYGDWETWVIQDTGDTIPEQTDGAKIFVGTTAGGFKGTPKGRIWFDQVSLESVAPASGLANFRMKSDRDLAWYTLKQPVIFKTSQAGLVSPKIKSVTATIYDSRDQIVDRVTASREDFLKQGIVWNPKATGYYEFEFAYQSDGQKEPTKLSYVVSMRINTGAWLSQESTRHRIGVVTDEPRPLAQRVQFMGRHCGSHDQNQEDYDLFDRMELSFNRYHEANWHKLEPEKGQFQWEKMDKAVAMMKQHGPVIVNLWGTAQWASPHPDRTEIDIFIPKYCAFAPVNMDDFRHFLRVMVNRYKDDVKIWEIWNEPHLPYGSIFWRDTPEKFVELLKAGYETIKEVQPEAEIWIGGMGGRRYLPFYKEFLRLGGGVYYDRLALHGSWPTTPPYRALEKKHGAPSKPWVDSEWHCILINASDERLLSDIELGHRMLTDLCVQIKDNVEKITVFCMTEWIEKEFILALKKEGIFAQSAGLFRNKPYRQPRLPAVLLRTFIDQFAGQRIDYVNESMLGDQCVVQLTSDRGPVMVIWSKAPGTQPLDQTLSAMIDQGGRFIDWEGKSVSPQLVPGVMYYLIPAKGQTIAKLPSGSALPVEPISRRDVPVAIENVFHSGRLFASAESDADPKAIRWIDKGWTYQAQDGKPQPGTFQARMAVAMNVDGLDLLVEVDDAVQHQKAAQGGRLYAGDSLQFAIATDDTGHIGSQVEFQVGFIGDKPVIHKDLAPWAAGDLPANWSQTGQPIKYGWVKIDRQATKTVYRLHIDKSELYPWAYSPDDPQFFSLLVNNNDGHGRAGYLTWSAGIGEKKDPTRYGRLKPLAP